MVVRGAEYFITTDNPAFYFESYGLGTKEAEVSFPLSLTHALHGTWQAANSLLLYEDAGNFFVREVNRRAASGAVRFGYSHKNTGWLVALLRKENHFLTRLHWGKAPVWREPPAAEPSGKRYFEMSAVASGHGEGERAMKPIRLGSDADLGKLLSTLAEDTVSTAIHWTLYKDLVASASAFLRELNQSPAFWTTTRDAHRDMALVRLARLYDDQSRALNLPVLLATIRENLHLFDEPAFRERLKHNPHVDSLAQGVVRPDAKMLDADEQAVSHTDALVKRLVDLRNMVLAHRSSIPVLDDTKDPIRALDRTRVDTLFERASEIVNRYSRLYSASVYSMKIVGDDDFKDVLLSVRRDTAARERGIVREARRYTRKPQGT